MRVIRSLIWVPGFPLKSLPRRRVLCAGQLPRKCVAFPLRPLNLRGSLRDLTTSRCFCACFSQASCVRGLGKTDFSGHVSDVSLRSRPGFVKAPRRSDLSLERIASLQVRVTSLSYLQDVLAWAKDQSELLEPMVVIVMARLICQTRGLEAELHSRSADVGVPLPVTSCSGIRAVMD
jgi:hypothetical protein